MSDGFVDVTFCTTSDDQEYTRRVLQSRGLYNVMPVTFTSTGLINDAVMYRPPVTPCRYCGRKAPADVYQCLGCGAPR